MKNNHQITTDQGFTFDADKPAMVSFWRHLDKDGRPVVSSLSFTGARQPRVEFGIAYTEFELKDQFGEKHFICELDIIQ